MKKLTDTEQDALAARYEALPPEKQRVLLLRLAADRHRLLELAHEWDENFGDLDKLLGGLQRVKAYKLTRETRAVVEAMDACPPENNL